MIRHFFHSLSDGFPSAIGLLSIGVVQSTILAPLVFALILTTFTSPSFRTALLGAIALTALAATTDEEGLAAQAAPCISECKGWGDDHVLPCQNGLDKGRRSVRAFSHVRWRLLLEAFAFTKTPIAAIGRGFSSSLGSTSLCHIVMASLLLPPCPL